MPRETLQPPELFESKKWGFSQVVVSPPGRIVHIAGQVAWDASERVVADDLEAQFRTALEHVFIAVRAAGGEPDDLQCLRFYIRNFQPGKDAETIARVLVDVFGTDNPPASSWIGVQALAQPEYLIEVEATAIVPDSR